MSMAKVRGALYTAVRITVILSGSECLQGLRIHIITADIYSVVASGSVFEERRISIFQETNSHYCDGRPIKMSKSPNVPALGALLRQSKGGSVHNGWTGVGHGEDHGNASGQRRCSARRPSFFVLPWRRVFINKALSLVDLLPRDLYRILGNMIMETVL